MTNILYLNNYMTQHIVQERNNENIYSQPANNKIEGITKALLENGCNITILSSGLVNRKTGKKYNISTEKIFGVNIIYGSIVDFPFLNTLSSIISIYREIRRQYKKKKVDRIIFYNYKPEVAWPAFFAKKILRIPITVEYEDGYSHVEGIGGIKAKIFSITEKKVSEYIDSAIVVNSSLSERYRVPAVVVRGVVNADFYNRCRKYKKFPNDKFTILYSGGLDKERGIDVLLKAVKYLDIDCRVIVTGKGNISCDDKRVEFRGFIPYEEVQNLMMQSDLLVQCQLSERQFSDESFPSKLFEYIATGNPIVSSAIKDVMDFAHDSFYYYFNDDPKDLAGAIKRAYERRYDDVMRIKIRELCRKNMPFNVGKTILKCWEKENLL